MYNIIIPVVYRDYSFLTKTIKYVCQNLNPKTIFIVTDGKMTQYIPKGVRNNTICRIIDENSVIDGLTYRKINAIIKSQGREHTNTGWFFQQFLKMAFAMSKYCDEDYYLSWDADTIPLQKISFFDEYGAPYFTMKTEYHKPYFDSIKKLLNLDKLNPRSYIAEHMLFKKEIMIEMIDAIEHSNVAGNTWYEKIMNSIVPEVISTDSFSEFETYGTYCKSYYPDLYKERQIPGFRKAALIRGRFVSEKILKKLSDDVFIASFEIYDRPPFPWSIICNLYETIRKQKELLIMKYFCDAEKKEVMFL